MTACMHAAFESFFLSFLDMPMQFSGFVHVEQNSALSRHLMDSLISTDYSSITILGNWVSTHNVTSLAYILPLILSRVRVLELCHVIHLKELDIDS